MKKITTLLCFMTLGVMLWAYPIRSTQLPKTARLFLKNYWPNVAVASADRSGATYSVVMDDGATIRFNAKGLWQQLDNEYGLPTDFIPATIQQYVRKHYDTSIVVKVLRVANGYEVKLDSGFTLTFGTQGNLLKVD